MKSLLLVGVASESPCADNSYILQIIGFMMLIVRIVIPFIIMIVGIVKLIKNIKKKDSKIYVKSLIKRAIISAIVVVAPNILVELYGNIFATEKNLYFDYGICYHCLTNPYGQKCVDEVFCKPYRRSFNPDPKILRERCGVK